MLLQMRIEPPVLNMLPFKNTAAEHCFHQTPAENVVAYITHLFHRPDTLNLEGSILPWPDLNPKP